MKHELRVFLYSLCVSGAIATSLSAQQPVAPKPAAPPSKRLTDSVNPSLPRWLRFNGEYRVRFEGIGAAGFKPASNDAFVLNRVRVNMTIAPLPFLRMQFQGQDAQVMGRNAKPDAPPFEDTFDVRQAYVEIGNPESNTFAVRAGRQELVFGEQRLVGHLNWTNTARSFDAVRATYRSKIVRVDAFAASVVNLKDGEFDKRVDGNNLHGAYAVFNVIPNKGTVEPYVFWREVGSSKSEAGPLAKLNFTTIGSRLAGKLPVNFDYSVEMAGQTGGLGTDDVSAWAGHWALGHTLAKVRYKPRLIAQFNYASGDANPTDGRRQTFDQLYPTGHDKLGLSDQVGWKNIQVARAGVELKPTAKLTLSGSYLSWWLANTHDGLYAANGALVAKIAAGTGGRHVGQEGDIQAVFALSPQTQLSGGYARVFPGIFLKNATPGRAYRSSYAMVTYLF